MRQFKKGKAAERIAGSILKVQERFAKVLGKLSSSWKIKQQWIFLCCVCVVFGGFSVLAVVGSFSKKGHAPLSRPGAIKAPAPLPDETNLVKITDSEFKQIERFKDTLDKFSKDRPGLMDSIEQVEKLYYSQKK